MSSTTETSNCGSSRCRPAVSSRNVYSRALNGANASNNLINLDIAERVRLNLDLHHLWTDLTVCPIRLQQNDAFEFLDNNQITLVRGRPPEKLYATDTLTDDGLTNLEWILPARSESKWSVNKWVTVFQALSTAEDSGPTRILMALYTNDSTVVYYFVHRGLISPRKN
ncbi:Sen15 protein-domain-containing protein [Lipomyces arxii]|uniref:Sen15 protein-domain-containing protein n=1 Tax=Lipomyces arxii TaxID=56418 RepID=UPI0034CDB1E8